MNENIATWCANTKLSSRVKVDGHLNKNLGTKCPMSKRPMLGLKWPVFGLKQPMFHRPLFWPTGHTGCFRTNIARFKQYLPLWATSAALTSAAFESFDPIPK